jgi:hypothetical protein
MACTVLEWVSLLSASGAQSADCVCPRTEESHAGRCGSELLRRRDDSSWMSWSRSLTGATWVIDCDDGCRRILTLALFPLATGFLSTAFAFCIMGGVLEDGDVCAAEEDSAAGALRRISSSGLGSLCSLLRCIITIKGLEVLWERRR